MSSHIPKVKFVIGKTSSMFCYSAWNNNTCRNNRSMNNIDRAYYCYECVLHDPETKEYKKWYSKQLRNKKLERICK